MDIAASLNIKNNQIKYVITVLFLLSFLTGLFFINEGVFHCDSIVLAQAVENTYKTGSLQPGIAGRYGSVILNSILYLPFFILGDNADFTTRFSSILFHALSAVALFLFIKELFKDSIQALFASLLLSFTPFYLSPNTYGKEHGASIFFLIFSFYLLYRGLNINSIFRVGLASFMIGFAVSIRESVLICLPLYILLYLNPAISLKPIKIVFRENRFQPRFLLAAFGPLSVIFCLIFFTYLRQVIYRNLFVQATNTVFFLGLFSPVLKIALRDLILSLSPLMFILFIFGIIKMFSAKDSFLPIFFLLWFLLIFYFGNTNGYGPRHLDVVAIPIQVFASYKLSKWYEKNKLFSSFIIICLVLTMFVFIYPMLEFRHVYNGEKQFALYVREKTEDNAIVIAMDDGPFIEYYGKRKFIKHPIDDAAKISDFIKTIDKYLKNDVPIYLIESGLSYDTHGVFGKMIFKHFDVITVGNKLTEDFHRPELKFQTYREKLFKLQLKR